tara:strand:- start:1574 stop:2377 length:804 start_codon:yes stop_codon:yes gene_type:complete
MKIFYVIILLCIVSCSDSSKVASETKENNKDNNQSNENSTIAIPDNRSVDHYKILFIGNSHVAGNNLHKIVRQLFESNLTSKLVTSQRAPGSGFLDDRINDGITLEKIQSEQWTHIVLQAQKVSATQSRLYPTKAAESWIELVKKELSATPILFPEHRQKNRKFEGRYIHAIHLGIAEKTPACVAPVGLAWDLALTIYPDLILHQDDGNHANVTGSFLTALVFYQTISGESAENLPYIENIAVSSAIQEQLAQVASQAIAENEPCLF